MNRADERYGAAGYAAGNAVGDSVENGAGSAAERGKSPLLLKLSKLVRVISVPPVMVAGIAAALAVATENVFRSPLEAVLTVLFLAAVPLLAYPLSHLLPKVRTRGRDGQRDLAFTLSAVGYAGGWLYGVLAHVTPALQAIFTAYLFSVTLLLIFNKLLFLRASGHASSVTGPLLLAAWFIGGWSIPAAVALYALIFWASVYAGRHTRGEFLTGTALTVAATVAAFLIYLL